jgi:hypothetical protein
MIQRFRGMLATGILLASAALSPARAAWRPDTPLPVSYLMTRTVAGDGFLYKIGGLGDKGICGSSDVLYAPIAADGSIGAWTATTSLPAVGDSTVTVTCADTAFQVSNEVIGWGDSTAFADGYVYVLGGNRYNFTGFPDGSLIQFSSAVYYARANADGSLGAWRRAADLPDANFFGSAAVSGGFLYLTGGRDAASTPFVSHSVLYAALNADGSLGPWKTAAAPMPGGLWLHAAAAVAGRLYVTGGVTYDPLPADQITNAVYSAPIDAVTGDVGAWREESSLPIGLAGHGLEVRHGVLYTVAGEEPTFPSVSVHQAGVNPDGTLAPWTDAPSLPVALYLHGSASFGGSVYALGGSDGSTAQKAVYALPDQTAPAAISDLAAAPAGADSLSLSWTAPGNDGAYGSVTGGQYRLSVAPDAGSLGAAAPVAWTATFDPGEAQAWTLDGLSAGTTYYLSLSAVDEAGNAGGASNVVSARTYFLAQSTESTPVASLESPVPGLTIAGTAAPAPLPFVAVSPVYRISPDAPLDPGLLTVSFAAKDLSAGLALFAWDGTAWSSAAVTGQAVDSTADSAAGVLSRTGLVVLLDTLRATAPDPGPPPSPDAVSYDAVFAPSVLQVRSRGRGPLTAVVPALMGRRGRVQAGSVKLTEVDGAAVEPVPALASASGPFGGEDEARGRGHGRGHAFGERGGDRFGAPDGLFRFDRDAVASRLSPGEHRATVTGLLSDGRAFRATGRLRLEGESGPGPVARRGDGARYWPAPACLLALKGGTSADDAPFPVHGRSNARDARAVAKGRIEVRVPSDAVAASLDLTISSTAADAQPDRTTRERRTERDGFKAVSAPVVFGPEGTRFAKPVTITIPYDPSLLPAGADESSLTVRYWNPSSQHWEAMPSQVDRVARVVRAQTTHFSLYQVLAAPASGGPAASAASDFSLRAAYAFPNPVHGAGVVTFRIQTGVADSVAVRVYDLAGRKIHESADFTLSTVDDGNGLGSQYTYDHAWSVSGVASGVYTYVITAKKAGSETIRKSGRVAVIK